MIQVVYTCDNCGQKYVKDVGCVLIAENLSTVDIEGIIGGMPHGWKAMMLPDSGSGSGKIIVACCVSCQFVLDMKYQTPR